MELTLHGRPDPLFKRDMGTEAFSFSSRLIRRNAQLIDIMAVSMLPVEFYFLFLYLKLKKKYFMIIKIFCCVNRRDM